MQEDIFVTISALSIPHQYAENVISRDHLSVQCSYLLPVVMHFDFLP